MTPRRTAGARLHVTLMVLAALSAARPGARPQAASDRSQELRSTIAFVSSRHNPTADAQRALLESEIYLMNPDGTNLRRLTQNTTYDGFPALSSDGTRIVFDSHRDRAESDPLNTSDLFVMNTDGTAQMRLVSGSSGTWSPDGEMIAFHASASGSARPIKVDPGAATTDSDIFVLGLRDVLQKGAKPRNLTSNPAAIDDDPDWSPTAAAIVFTSHEVTDDPQNSATAEIYVTASDGSGKPSRLTQNHEEERGPSWSPDGARILYMCRKGSPAQPGGPPTFELCVMNADGTDVRRLTNNAVPELTPSWSPDGRQIVFHRPVEGRAQFQLFIVSADGTGERQLTFPPGLNGFPDWGGIRR